jgi:uncharacterized protein (TIGR02217 family)
VGAGAWHVGRAFKLLRDFHRVAMGRLNGFRFRDPFDYKDEGAGGFVAGSGGKMQMVKTYTVGSSTYVQTITKPVSGTITITGGGSLDYTTGLVTGGSPTAWTGNFDVPCRFGDDVPQAGLDSSGGLWSWNSLKIVEIRV